MKNKSISLTAILLCGVLATSSCGAKNNMDTSLTKDQSESQIEQGEPAEIEETEAVELAKPCTEREVYEIQGYNPKKLFITISKIDQTLSVYAPMQGDTLLVARYPVCLSKNKGQKQKSGDMRTPECTQQKPFKISQIQNASDWHHDFGDGRGSIKAYGNWFLRLETPGHKGIGIHGSTNNEATVPGRASEGCIRLRDVDIQHLKENYAYVGMPVIIKAEDEGKHSYEK